MSFDKFELPRAPRRRWAPWAIVFAVLLVFILLSATAGLITEWLWYREVGRTDVYWTMFWERWLLGIVVGLGFFALVFSNIYLALRGTPDTIWREWGQRLRERELFALNRILRRLILWGSAGVTLLLAWGTGRSAADYWTQFLLFAHAQRFGATDPIFHRDIGFYLFQLPMWELLQRWLMVTLITALVLTTLIYLVTRAIRTVRGIPVFSPAVARHLSVLLALIFAVKAAGYYLGRYATLYDAKAGFVGAGFTDVHARIPGLMIMMVVALLAAVVMLVNIRLRNVLLPVLAVAGMILLSILVLSLYPAAVQSFRVEPNELALERPYLANHIAMTRQAYGLEGIRTNRFAPTPQVTTADVAASPAAVNNIRLWDYRQLIKTYRQQQELRTYYEMHDIDVDRYQINNRSRQVMLSPRELNTAQLPVQNWVNTHLIYTHGYGLAMSPVNEFDPQSGEPIYFISDIPPRVTVPSLRVTRPEIYFGELTNDYIIVKSGEREFDYARGEDDNAFTTYQGKAGISLRNWLVRLLMAMRFGSTDLLISGYIRPESRIVFNRNVMQRIQAAAPFLSFDDDPYAVLGTDGRLYWMVDAYTRSLRFPYSQRHALEVAGEGSIASNYVRNPVKVVVDAYHGDIAFYVVDDREPFIRAWSEVFPGMFQPMTAIPAGLAAHVRVPEGLFNALSEIYARYHMTNPTTYYTQEDLWQIARESASADGVAGSTGMSPMEAYYLIMSLPGQTRPEYLLIRPYTPANKKNMIAWLSASNDPERYGELFVYNFPKQSLVAGPELVEANINQDTEISQAFTLWGQVGSRIFRGNLLVIPLGKSILYVQPIYLLAEQSSLPELQRVILADQEKVVMRRTLADALAALTGGQATTEEAPIPGVAPPTSGPSTLSPAQRALARSALEHYNRAQQALRRGDWTTYGREMEAVRQDLEALNR